MFLHRLLIRDHLRCSIKLCMRGIHDFEVSGLSSNSTSVTMLSQDNDENICITGYSKYGFRFSNGFCVVGPCVLFPRSILHWAVEGPHSINESSLSLFAILDPRPGIGNRHDKYNRNIVRFLQQNRISFEILPTEKACSTFNFLNADRRAVVAAIIPPTYVELTDKERELYDLREVEKEQRENVFEPFVEIKEDDRFIKVGVNPKLFEDLNTRQPNDRK